MSEESLPYARTRAAVIAGLVFVLILAIFAALYLNRSKPACCTNVTTNEGKQEESLTAKWRTFNYSPFALTFLVPSGMNVCLVTDAVEVRNDACGASTKPTYRIWQRNEWDEIDPVSAFNDAYAQQLKESGIETVSGKTSERTTGRASTLLLNVSESLTGAIVSNQTTSPTVWKVAVDINRDVPPVIRGSSASADEITSAVFDSMSFATRRERPVAPKETDAWPTFTSETGDFSISYPATARTYAADPAAALSVMTTAGSKLEVRSASNIDASKPSLTDYRKLTETTIDVNGSSVKEERYVPVGVPNSPKRILFVPFTNGSRVVGVSFIFAGEQAEEDLFKKVLTSFSFKKQ